MKRSVLVVIAACAVAMSAAPSAKKNKTVDDPPRLSPMGALAERARAALIADGDEEPGGEGSETCDEVFCDPESPAPAGQAEMAVAVDATGRHVVVGFNDFRGFSLNPL